MSSSASSEQAFRSSLAQFRWSPATTELAPPQPSTSNPSPQPGFIERLYNSTSAYVPLRSDDRSNEEEAYFALSRWERLLGFGACLLGSAVCFTVAFFTLPLLAIRPGKFALAFSLASLLVMFGFAVLSGPLNHIKHLLSPARLPFSATYLGSLGLTLYFSVVVRFTLLLNYLDALNPYLPSFSIKRKSYLGSLIFAIAQVVALVIYIATYFPGGWQTIRFGGQMAFRGAGGVLPF